MLLPWQSDAGSVIRYNTDFLYLVRIYRKKFLEWLRKSAKNYSMRSEK